MNRLKATASNPERAPRGRLPAWTAPIAAAVLGILCYGLMIPWLGFYWDDLSYQYSLSVFGPAGFQAFVAHDRPFSASIYVVTATLFGDHPLAYQALNLVLRLLTAAALWWLLRSLWPKRGAALAIAPILFVVYPGFLQQPISFIYNLHWINYLQTLLSLGCMVQAARGRRRLAWSAAALLLAPNYFSLEYSFGLDLLRPLLLYLVLDPGLKGARRLGKTLLCWLPYLGINLAFLLWTLVLFHNNMYSPAANTGKGLATRATSALSEVFQVALLPWLRLFEPLGGLNFTLTQERIFWLVALIASAAVFFYLLRLEKEEASDSFAWQAILVGLWALLPAGVPFWGTGLHPATNFPYDRFTLPFIAGICILISGLSELLLRGRARKILLFSILAGLAAAAQFQNTNSYRREWDNLQIFFDQLTWRAPGLNAGTLLLTHDLPFKYYSDFSLSAALNLTYAPEQRNDPRMPYLLLYLHDRASGTLAGLQPGMAVSKNYRSLDFNGNTNQALVIFYSPPGCLRVVDPKRPQEMPAMPDIYRDVAALSHPDQIQTQPPQAAQPLPRWFAAPPTGQSWCYFFLKAELARQAGDWKEVLRLEQAAADAGMQPGAPTERDVFIEARARLGDSAGALDQVNRLAALSTEDKNAACAEWIYLETQGLSGGQVPEGCSHK